MINREITKKIIITGHSNVGKTAIIKRLITGEFVQELTPTIEFSQRFIRVGNTEFTIFDWGGLPGYRERLIVEPRYLASTSGLIYVIDISNQSCYQKTREYFWCLIMRKELEHTPIAIFANKIDKRKDFLEKELLEEELTYSMGFTRETSQKIKIFQTSAKTGEGIQEGFNWLIR